MTASTTFAEDVTAGIANHSRRPVLNFLRNFGKSRDKAGADTAASVSTVKVADTRTLAASAADSLDLAGGFATMTKVHAIYVKADPANTNGVVVGGAAANGFAGPFADITDKVTVGPGETVLFTSKAGWAVTAGTGDILKIANSGAGTSVSYDVLIAGE